MQLSFRLQSYVNELRKKNAGSNERRTSPPSQPSIWLPEGQKNSSLCEVLCKLFLPDHMRPGCCERMGLGLVEEAEEVSSCHLHRGRAPTGHSSQTHLPCSAPWEPGLHKFPHVSSCKDSETSHSGYRGNKIVAQGSVVTSCAVPRTTDGNLYSQQNCCY